MKIDLEKLTSAQRKKIERAVKPLDTLFSRRFCSKDAAGWRARAALDRMSLTAWVSDQLNAAVRTHPPLALESGPPDCTLSFRCNAQDAEAWKKAAEKAGMFDREWVARTLNSAVSRGSRTKVKR